MLIKYCDTCGDELKPGVFAYQQQTCWSCFNKEVSAIIVKQPTNREKLILKFLLDVVTEAYGFWR